MKSTDLTTGPLLDVPTAKPQWMHYGDWLRILGTIAVVVGHVSDMVLSHPYHPLTGQPLPTQWWVANVWDSLSRWAVPLYIMLSGSLLLDPTRAESPGTFYRKRLARLGVPLVFWSLFFMGIDTYYTRWHTKVLDGYETVIGGHIVYLWSQHSWTDWLWYLLWCRPQPAWMNLLAGQPYVHMHFIFRIAGLYAFTPMFRVFVRHAPRPMLVTTVVLLLCLSSADSVANNFTGTSISAFSRFTPFIGYYLAGYLLRNVSLNPRQLLACSVGWMVCIAMLAVFTGFLVHHYVIDAGSKSIHFPPSMELMLYDFLSPIRVVIAVLAWLVLVTIFRDPWPHSVRGRSIVRFLANTTLGLYLIHPLFREMWHVGRTPALCWIEDVTPAGLFNSHVFQFLWQHTAVWFQTLKIDDKSIANGIDGSFPNVWVGIPLMTLLVYVPSLVATIVLMRIPYVRRVTG